MMKPLLPVVVLVSLSVAALNAQIAGGDAIEVTGINADYATTPEFNFKYGPKGKAAKNRDWLEIETTFNWQPKPGPNAPKYLDELTFNYYVLLNNPNYRDANTGAQGALLVGRSVLTAVSAGKGLHTVIYVSPRTLDRFFDGKPPASASGAVKEASVVVTRQGQVVAYYTTSGKAQQNWWNTFPPIQGYLLNKNETPFAPLAWDYYEPLKASPSGSGF